VGVASISRPISPRRLVARSRHVLLWLFTKPAVKTQAAARIVFVADYSSHGLEAFEANASCRGPKTANGFYVIRIITAFDEARRVNRRSGRHSLKSAACMMRRKENLERFVLSAGTTEVPVEVRCVRGQYGLVAREFRPIGEGRFAL